MGKTSGTIQIRIALMQNNELIILMKQTLLIFALTVVIPFFAEAQNDTISKTKEMQEIVVSATRPLSKLDADGIVTTITNTPLQSLESASDVLGYIPGVISNNGSIEVVGKGKPIIYINRRKLVDYSELKRLPASKIKEIKVINNPGVRYESSTGSVIRITTVKELGDGFSMDTRSTLGFRDYVYGKEQINLNYRTGGLDIFAGAEYANIKAKGSSMITQNLWGTYHQFSTIGMDSRRRTQTLNGKIGFNYTTASNHSFGAFYQHIYSPIKSDANSNSSVFMDNLLETESDAYTHKRENGYSHLVDAYYSGNWGNWAVDATFNYLWKEVDNCQDTKESIIGQNEIIMHLNDNSRGRMFAGELNFSRPLLKGNVELGASYTNTSRSDLFDSDFSAIVSNDNQVKENITGVYGQLSQRFGKITVQAGLRYEHIGSDYYEFGKKMPEQSAKYDELLPSASIVFPIRNTTLQLSYSRKYSRPLYSQLSSTVTYVNQYTYETGNPNLKNSFIDNVTLNVRYKWWVIMASYKHTDARIISVSTEYGDNPDVTLFKKENSKRGLDNLDVFVSAMPGFIGKFYYPVAMAGITAQFYDIDYKGGIKHMNSPMALVRLNNMFRLPSGYTLNVNMSYRSDFDGENIHLSRSWQIDLSVLKTINKHWDFKFSANDIFNTARRSKSTIYSGIRDTYSVRYNTLRGIELTVGYKFNVTKSKYKGKGAGNAEKDRL